jgi:hypothetical protein
MRYFPLLLLLALPAFADTEPTKTKINNTCYDYNMCVAETTTSACTNQHGDEIVLDVGRYANYTFYSTQTTSTDYSCDIYTAELGFDAAVATDQVNTTSITDEAPVLLLAGLLGKIWLICPTNADNSVVINARVCTAE